MQTDRGVLRAPEAHDGRADATVGHRPAAKSALMTIGKRLGRSFDPADQIDGGADHGEIKPVGGPDIAVDRRANVTRYDDLERRLAHE